MTSTVTPTAAEAGCHNLPCVGHLPQSHRRNQRRGAWRSPEREGRTNEGDEEGGRRKRRRRSRRRRGRSGRRGRRRNTKKKKNEKNRKNEEEEEEEEEGAQHLRRRPRQHKRKSKKHHPGQKRFPSNKGAPTETNASLYRLLRTHTQELIDRIPFGDHPIKLERYRED